MLPRSRRISRSEFKSLGRGTAFHSPLLSLFVYKKENSRSSSQFSFSVSKKVSKHAVIRNRLRRQGYAVLRSNLVSIVPGVYGAFVYKKEANSADWPVIKKEVEDLLGRAHLVS